MTYYLVEFKDINGLHVRLFDGTEELARWLSDEIEHAYYSGDGSEFTVYKHHEGGKLEKLAVKLMGCSEDTENDYSHYGYAVGVQKGEVVEAIEATFSVRIDGRA